MAHFLHYVKLREHTTDNVDCSYFANITSHYWYKSCLTCRVNCPSSLYAVILSEAEDFAVFHRPTNTIGRLALTRRARLGLSFTTVGQNGQDSRFGKGRMPSNS
jgi:hypothetical protein